MYDPMTVAFDFRRIGLTIWHKDPEKHGDDDSCDWFGRHNRKLTDAEHEVLGALEDMATLLDNSPHFPDSPEHKRFQVLKACIGHSYRRNGWRLHPRWHFWHWRFQLHWLQNFKRWAFSRCIKCGKRFPWGYCPVATWQSHGPRWFRNEEAWHSECDRTAEKGGAQ